MVSDFFEDRRRGIETFSEDEDKSQKGVFGDEDAYGACSYEEIRQLIAFLRPSVGDIFVDIGCGKGRVLFEFARLPIQKCIGVELQQKLCSLAETNLSRLPAGHAPVEVRRADAAEWRFTDETLVFIYNSFGFRTFRRVIETLKENHSRRPRPLAVIYFGPYGDFLDSEEWLKNAGRVPKSDIWVWKAR